MRINRPIETGAYPIPNRDFKPAANHHFIMNFAEKNGGIFSSHSYRDYARKRFPEKKDQDKAIRWNQTTTARMEAEGYLISCGAGEYRVNPLALALLQERKSSAPVFEVKSNHRKLLEKHKNGTLAISSLKSEFKDKQPQERIRQERMIDCMIRNLKNNGYLIPEGRGVYKLSPEALALLETAVHKPTPREKSVPSGVSITAFDRLFLEVSADDRIDDEMLLVHPRSESLKKRLVTLTNAGFIKDNTLAPDFVERLNLISLRKSGRELTLEQLSARERQTLKDVRLFLNLSPEQIIRFIYNGNADYAKRELRYLTSKDILVKEQNLNMFVLGKKGVELSNQLFPCGVRYKSKIRSRPEEVRHDAHVYTAYKELESKLLAEGMEIRDVKSDRQLRSEDAKRDGNMTGSYPDLRVEYYDPKTRTELSHDIEIDCGYDARTIASKISGLCGGSSAGGGSGNTGLDWCVTNMRQASKVIRIANTLNHDRSKTLRVAKHLSIFIINDKLELKKIKWN